MHFNMDFSLGNMVSAGAMLLTIWAMHRQNARRHDKEIAMLANMKMKLNLMWRSFCVEKGIDSRVFDDSEREDKNDAL